jgi:hypothetical protein
MNECCQTIATIDCVQSTIHFFLVAQGNTTSKKTAKITATSMPFHGAADIPATFSSLLRANADAWWSVRRFDDLQREQREQQHENGANDLATTPATFADGVPAGVTEAALRSAAECRARMLLRVQPKQRWLWGSVSCSTKAAALLRRQTADGCVPFVAHEYLVDPIRASAATSAAPLASGTLGNNNEALDWVPHRPFLDVEIEVALLGEGLGEAVRARPNDCIALLTRHYVEAFSAAFGFEPHCLWMTSHVAAAAADSGVSKASFHMTVNSATRLCDGTKHRVYFKRISTQRAFVAQFERHLARALFASENWSAHDVDRVVPFEHAALSLRGDVLSTKLPPAPKPWIDSGVYRAKHSLRMPLASKDPDELRPMMPYNFAIDNSDGNGGIEAACLTGFALDGGDLVALDDVIQQQCAPPGNMRAEQCRAALGALATSLARLCGGAAAAGFEISTLWPLLHAHRECENSLRAAMTRVDDRGVCATTTGEATAAFSSETAATTSASTPATFLSTAGAFAEMQALDRVLTNLRKVIVAFQEWCTEHGVPRRAPRFGEPLLPFETAYESGVDGGNVCNSNNRNRQAGGVEQREISFAQQQHEWPIALQLAAQHLCINANNVRLSKAILYARCNSRGEDVASYIGEPTGGAQWYCPLHERLHSRRKFRININQQTGHCLLRCGFDSAAGLFRDLDEIETYTMRQEQ